MKDNKLFSVYGARLSKSKERINISIVTGEEEAAEWGTISVKIDNPKGKTQVKIKDDFVYLKVPMLKELNKTETKAKKEKTKEVNNDDLPF